VTVGRADVVRWLDAYERVWRTAGTDGLTDLFTPDVTYSPSPWREPVRGLEQLGRFWERARQGADEGFTMIREIVAVDGDTAVVRVAVDYLDASPAQWRDLWVLRFAADRRCRAFEEWPFAPDTPDGH
jgi:hypothetical protein